MSTMMTLSVRETRMIVERILLVTGLPEGFVPAVRDCVLYSQAMGLDGLEELKRAFEVLKQARPQAIRALSERDRSVLDGAGQHAWVAAPGVLDIALASARNGSAHEIAVGNLVAPRELCVLASLAGRYGAEAHVSLREASTPQDIVATVRITADTRQAPDAILTTALTNGLPVRRALWEELYAWSHDALTPDSIESRRHAGPVMVDAEGRVHGRDDDDTDFSLLGIDAGTNKTMREDA